MFMAQNTLTGVYTLHVDTWYHFMRESVEEGTINIEFFDHLSEALIFYEECESGACKIHVKKFLGIEETGP
jgi:DNA-dependent RNA polymerase auxiliary subunit epsilon